MIARASLAIACAACESTTQCAEEAACAYTSDACGDGAYCEDSLECTLVDPRTRCATEADQVPRCRPGAFRRLALQDGFGVGGMPIAMGESEVSWQPLRDAQTVACALFVCNPQFVPTGCSPTGAQPRREIANVASCVLLFRASPVEQTRFSLIDESVVHEPRCDGAPASLRVVGKLAVGCWAYDTTHVIAASELVPVSGHQLPTLSAIPHGSRCRADGDDCYDEAGDRFGVCLDGQCAPRCRTRVDCALAAPQDAPGGACEWSCSDVPGSSLGACVRR